MANIDKICHGLYSTIRSFHADHEHLAAEPLKEFVDAQIASGRYSSVSEYIRELIRQDEKRKAEERLEALLLEGLESEETALTRQDLDDIRSEALAQLKARQKHS
jgi:antitoxin ParD1/3/4